MLFLISFIFVLRTVVKTKPLTSGIFLSTSAIFILRKVVVTKPLTSDIFLLTFPIFSLNFVCLCYIYLCESKESHQEFYSLNYLLLYLVCSTMSFLLTVSLNFLKSIRTAFNSSASKYSTLVFRTLTS